MTGGWMVAGGALALALFTAAWQLRWLSPGGLAAAFVVGAAVLVGAGAGGLALLLLFFVTASILTAWNPARAESRRAATGRRTPSRPARPGRPTPPVEPTPPAEAAPPAEPARPARSRAHPGDDARGRGGRQVLANGGVAAACALLGLAGWLPHAHYALAGALAAATADTWATEAGTGAAGRTRLITTWERVPPGRSGGVSGAGTLAGITGALLLGAAAALFLGPATAGGGPALDGWGWLVATAVGGSGGLALDSVLGATLETRVERMDNDLVNLLGTVAGAVLAWSTAVAWAAAWPT